MTEQMEIEVDRQSVRPGDEIRGTLRYPATGPEPALTFRGEEVLAANNIIYSLVSPLFERRIDLAPSVSEGEPVSREFVVKIPLDSPPSYASQDLRCQYTLVAERKTGFLRAQARRLHVTVLPPMVEVPTDGPVELGIDDGSVRLETWLDRSTLASGEPLTGGLLLHRESPTSPLPVRLSFRLACIEESTEESHRHRRVLWLVTHDVSPRDDMAYPLQGEFSFPIARDAPFSGDWGSFRVHYGFRAAMNYTDGRQVRRSVPICVIRRYIPAVEGLGIG